MPHKIPANAHGFDVLPCVERHDETGFYIERPHEGEPAQFWGVYSVDAHGRHTHVDDFPTETAARDYAAVLQGALDAAPSYRARYYASETYRRAQCRERRERLARRVLLVACFLSVAFAVAHTGAAIFWSL